jgi:hypothetical protein
MVLVVPVHAHAGPSSRSSSKSCVPSKLSQWSQWSQLILKRIYAGDRACVGGKFWRFYWDNWDHWGSPRVFNHLPRSQYRITTGTNWDQRDKDGSGRGATPHTQTDSMSSLRIPPPKTVDLGRYLESLGPAGQDHARKEYKNPRIDQICAGQSGVTL